MRRGRPGTARAALVLAALLLAAGCGEDAPAADAGLERLRSEVALQPCPTSVGDLPDLTFPCLGGGPDVPLKGPGTGTPTLVNVYGSWCAPCQEEMPVLVAFSEKAGGKVDLLGVDTQDEPRLGLLFARDFGQRWPAVVDADGVLFRRYAPGPPVTLFVAGSGEVRFVHRGPFRSLADLEQAVETHLGVTL